MTSAYIHIPFCDQICFYCDFPKVLKEDQPIEEYLTALRWEMEQYQVKEPCETLYIGGGTPSSLNEQELEQLLASVRETLPFSGGEFTFEVNPGDLNEAKLHLLEEYGVNRLSMGVQTFNETLLKKIGRKHNRQDVYDTLHAIEKYSTITNVSLDLIYALPKQTLEDFQATLKEAVELGLPHFSLYALILENQTVFANLARRGKLLLPTQEEEVSMEEWAQKYLEARGWHRYELSNYGKEGYESQHNLMYWDNKHYYGFGAGGSGYLGNERYRNHAPIQHYLAACQKGELPIVEKEVISRSAAMEEQIFLGLRKTKGVSKKEFATRFHQPIEEIYGSVISDLLTKGLLQEQDDFLSLTSQGRLFGNDVFVEFLLDK